MKKIFKNFATTFLVGVGFFMGASAIEHTNHKQTNEIKKQEKTTRSEKSAYSLTPGQEFDPNSSEFNGYWNKLDVHRNGAYDLISDSYWLLAIESVKELESDYQINFDYSFFGNLGTNSFYYTHLWLRNDSRSYNEHFLLKEIYNYDGSQRDYQNDTINVPKQAISNNQRLIFDIEFQSYQNTTYSYQIREGTGETFFDLNNYQYLDDFYIHTFNMINDSITDEGFNFLIDIELTNGDDFSPLKNNLILYSNSTPLQTQAVGNFKSTKEGFIEYSVSGLQADAIYTNFEVGIYGYDDIKSVGNLTINTKPSGDNGNNNFTPEEDNLVWIVSSSVVGGIILLLLILLIILVLLKRRKKVVEYNYYHDYNNFIDYNGNYIGANQPTNYIETNQTENDYYEY